MNRHGCHNETATGGHHCHPKRKEKKDEKKLLQVLLIGSAVAIVIYAIYRAHQNQKGAASMGVLPEEPKRGEWEPWVPVGEGEDTTLGMRYQMRF